MSDRPTHRTYPGGSSSGVDGLILAPPVVQDVPELGIGSEKETQGGAVVRESLVVRVPAGYT